MRTVYRITLWHGDGKASSWDSEKLPRADANGIFGFTCKDGLKHWITGSVEITEFEEGV